MATARASCTVLLIDDEAAGLKLRELVLKKAGFRTLAATSCDAGLKLFQAHDVAVVVTDHLLGRGTASAMALSMRRYKPAIPIVSLSGTSKTYESVAYSDYFVPKSDGPDALIIVLDKILEREGVASGPELVVQPYGPDAIPMQALLAAILEDSSDAILSKTMNGIITSWNHSAELMYGYTRDETIGKSVAMFLPPDRPDELIEIFARLKRGERIENFETVRMTKNRDRLNVSLTISPIRNAKGRLVGASSSARNISNQKRTEEALRKSEKFVIAGRMAATVAHEINNPLESIGNVLYLLRNSTELQASDRTYVETAQEELKRVSEIIRLTLGMQRDHTDRREAVQMTKLLDNVLTLYQHRVRSLSITLERRYEYDGVVFGLRGELRQVFSNLIVNAMEALATTGDKLILRVRRVRQVNTGEIGVRVSIIDNGPGMSPEHCSQLFQIFHTTKGENGTGIGLWVSKGIVQKHGGTIRVHSSVRPGRSGTCFSVFLPLGSDPQKT